MALGPPRYWLTGGEMSRARLGRGNGDFKALISSPVNPLEKSTEPSPRRAQGQALMLRKAGGAGEAQQWASLVDGAVYSRNRHFRLLGSCKAGKAAVLLPSGRYATAPHAQGAPRALNPVETKP